MPIKVTINSSEPSVANKVIQVTIKGPIKIDYNFDIHVREALNGDFMIFDHHDIDVVILKEQKKIVAFAKDLMTEEVYGAEARLFDFLRKSDILQTISQTYRKIKENLKSLEKKKPQKKTDFQQKSFP